MHPEGDSLYRLEFSGTLGSAEFDDCAKRLAAEIDRVGPVRLLVILTDLRNWQPSANWGDMTFYANYGHSIKRIAIVGPPRWRSQALMFAGADLRKAPVEFFPVGTHEDARAWLSS
jgi:hypothetical protein